MTRRRLAAVVLMIALATIVAAASAVDAHVRWYVGAGPFWWPYPYPWYASPYYPYPPVVVEPPVYIEMRPPTAYWYYCGPSQAYYPDVQTCTEPWIKVPATR